MARGFSIVEIMVVLGIFAAIVSTGLALSIDQIARGTIFSERDTLVSLLNGARAASLANVNAQPHGVHIDATQFVAFEGSAYSSSDPKNYPIARTSSVSMSGPTDIVFAQLSGEVSSGGTLILADGGSQAIIEVNDAGRIDW